MTSPLDYMLYVHKERVALKIGEMAANDRKAIEAIRSLMASELQKLSTREGDTIWYTDTENDVVMTLEDRIAGLLGDDKQSSPSVVDEADNHEQDGKR